MIVVDNPKNFPNFPLRLVIGELDKLIEKYGKVYVYEGKPSGWHIYLVEA